MITKTERAELRSIVRQQFKVLRSEITQRRAELVAQVEEQISQRFAKEDKAWADAAHEAHEAVMEANRRVNDAYRDLLPEKHVERMYVHAQAPGKPTQERNSLRVEAIAQIDARVKGALLQLERQEADLLRSLAVGAIESEEARSFLTAIPTVGELVPDTRLAALEAQLSELEGP